MRILCYLFGREVIDLRLGLGSPPDESDDDAPGSCTTYPVGFVRDQPAPWEDPGHDRA